MMRNFPTIIQIVLILMNLKFYTKTFDTLFGGQNYIASIVSCHFINLLFNIVSLDIGFFKTFLNSFHILVSTQLLLHSFRIVKRDFFSALLFNWSQSMEVL